MITETKVKELVNSLVDLKEDNTVGYDGSEFIMRNHGIDLAIMKIKSRLLGIIELNREEGKFDIETELVNQ